MLRLGAKWAGLIATTVALGLVGCNQPEDDTAPAFVPKTVVFEGELDPRFFGSWKGANGTSNMELAEDGTVKMATTIAHQGGSSTNAIEGKWRFSSGSLIFQYGKDSTTVKYPVEFKDGNLVMGGSVKTTYTKNGPQKPSKDKKS